MNVALDKSSVILATVKTAQELQQRDQELIQQYQGYILRLAEKNNNPVAISMYLQNIRNINIRVSALRSFLSTYQSWPTKQSSLIFSTDCILRLYPVPRDLIPKATKRSHSLLDSPKISLSEKKFIRVLSEIAITNICFKLILNLLIPLAGSSLPDLSHS